MIGSRLGDVLVRVLFGLTACPPGTLWWFVDCVTKEVYNAKFIGWKIRKTWVLF